MIDNNELLSELNNLYNQRICSKFPRVSKEDLMRDGVVIYGYAVHGQYLEKELLSHGIRPSWIVDKTPSLHGRSTVGIDIRPISSLSEVGSCYVLLGSTHVLAKSAECMRYNAEKWILPAALRAWCTLTGEIGICNDGERHFEEITSAYRLMSDDKSREIFMAYIRYHHTFYNDFSALFDPVLYFPKDLVGRIDYNFFVDVGAFTGDTLSDWIREGQCKRADCQYYAFEPDLSSFNQLKVLVDSLPYSVHAVNAIIGNESGTGFMTGQGMSASRTYEPSNQNEEGITLTRIDDLFADSRPTFIKADVEGEELNLLYGAEQTIRRCRPTLAISVYHWYRDIWTIPIWIHNLDCGYEIYLRHHHTGFTDTVCYAIASSKR